MLELCHWYQIHDTLMPLKSQDKERIIAQNINYATQAIRVLGCGYSLNTTTNNSLPQFVFVGMVGMIDPPRPEVQKAIQDCYLAGMKVIMITGDHLATAQAIARQIGLEGKAME